jgi:hypothetical protein
VLVLTERRLVQYHLIFGFTPENPEITTSTGEFILRFYLALRKPVARRKPLVGLGLFRITGNCGGGREVIGPGVPGCVRTYRAMPGLTRRTDPPTSQTFVRVGTGRYPF